ncbi:hypothetical protein P154DRAFT_527827 [Amniculicola lignicola CBS 123094]|uniref:DUF7514 domain-containing protein n=1 Tax=Amniculicola lignicola CBS 123094 TaxID=1392246 RepID=A0A6A5VV08_9PLEO|nr:hypothetical protein P154DRAFT_527827 [Amniculicola lignicola CBS 123094]
MAAYDGYRSQPDPRQHQPYSASYDASYDSRAYQAPPYSSYQEPPSPQRSRASSRAPSDSLPQPVQQPLKNALNNAFDKSDSARSVDPDLIAQITAEVKKSVLDEIKLSALAQAQAAPHQEIPQSPTSTSASFSSRNVYTPQSDKHADFSSHGSASPDPLAQDPMFDGSGDTPTPRHERSIPMDIPYERPRPRSRPAPVQRMSTDFTPIEKMWQRLFDPQGQPTPRLGQFLRGLAVHLIDDYEPKKSLVISPAKMLRFYEDVKLSDEIYPWTTIFDKLSYPALSKVYREMRCEHHLIQEQIADQPQIPALTPVGFEQWMTAMIQAYPSIEYERVSKAVLDMPISNADDCKERFPKELPRRLFPFQENLQAQQRCAAALATGGVDPLRRAPSFPPPPPMAPSSGPAAGLERERSPYATQPDSKAIDTDEEESEPLAIPIERERKPYSAAPGGGKIYEEELSRSMQSDSSFHDSRKRAQSSASQSQWNPPPNPSSFHPRTGSHAGGRRPRSPSFTNYGSRSDPSVRDMPGSYHSGPYDSEEENRKFARDAELKRKEWARRHAEDDAPGAPTRKSTRENSYDSQPRSVYDDDFYKGRGYEDRGYDSRRY